MRFASVFLVGLSVQADQNTVYIYAWAALRFAGCPTIELLCLSLYIYIHVYVIKKKLYQYIYIYIYIQG